MPFLTPAATQGQINTTTALSQNNSIVRQLSNGRYIVIWTDGVDQTQPAGPAQFANTNVRAQIFNADGTPFGSEFVVTDDPGTQLARAVVQLTDGNIVIAWQNNLNSGAASPTALPTTSAREFTIDGAPVGSAFTIGSTTVATQNVSLAPVAGGGFVASWYSGTNVGSVVSQVYNSSNDTVGSQITVDSTNIAMLDAPRTTLLDNGNYLVIYRETNPGSPTPVFISGQIYSASGVTVGPAMNLGSFANLVAVQTQSLPGGGFAVLSTFREPGSNDVVSWITTYSASGVADLQFEVQRDLAATALAVPTFAVTPGGGFVVSWSEGDVDNGAISDGSGSTLVAALYTADGNWIFPNPLPDITTPGLDSTYRGGPHAFQVNVQGTNGQGPGGIVVLNSGDIIFTWTDFEATDGSGSSVQQRLFTFDPTNRVPIAFDDRFIATGEGEGYGTDYLTDNDFDFDGQNLVVTSIFNVTGGTVTFNAATQQFQISRAPGSISVVEFDYTVSDGLGGTATAHARLLPDPSDNVSIRGAVSSIAFLANDYLDPRADGYQFTINAIAPPQNPFVNYSVTGIGRDATITASASYVLNQTGYAFLPVGQTITQIVTYNVLNPVTGAFDYGTTITVTLQGWAQIGGTGADNLVGTAQADHLVGGTGAANTLTGGAGDDWYTVQADGDIIVELAGEGTDTIFTSLATYVLPANVENLLPTSTSIAFNATGNGLNNSINGGSASDFLYGLDGNDILNGGAGADNLYGGLGDDRYTVDRQDDLVFENAGEGVDLVRSSSNYYLYANVENLTLLGTANNFGVGNELANVLNGNGGENLLIAGLGNDTVNGGGARDAIFGEDGDDILNGDAGVDYIVGGTGNDTIAGGNDADEIYGQEGDDTLRGGSSFDTDIMVGGLGNDTIFGSSGLGDYDLMYGNEGNDIFYVDTPDDLVFEQTGEGNDTVYADINGAGYYLYDNIENLVLQGDTPFGVGNALDNSLTGSETGNYLLGGAGNDMLNGGTGNDVLFGEAGNDIFVFDKGTGSDVIGDFTRGQDRIDLSDYGLAFSQIQGRFVQDGNVGAIQFANGDVLVFHNVIMSELTAADFILAPVSEAPPKADDLGSAFGDSGIGVQFADPVFSDSALHRWSAVRADFEIV